MHQTLTAVRTPLAMLREAVEASREVDAIKAQLDAAIERRGPILDAIVERMKGVGSTVVPFYVGAEYWAATREEDQLTLTRSHMPTALASPAGAGEAVRFDGAHACTDDEPRIDAYRSINPRLSPLPKEFPDYQSGDNLTDRDIAEFDRERLAAKRAWERIFAPANPSDAELSEMAANAVLEDIEADDDEMHVRPGPADVARNARLRDPREPDLFANDRGGPSLSVLATNFAPPDDDEDSDEGLAEGLDDADEDDDPTGEFEPIPDDVVVSEDAA